MTKNEYMALLDDALESAAKNAEQQLGRSVPRNFVIQLHGFAPEPRTLTKQATLDELYIGPEKLYRVIDVAVRRVDCESCTVFMSISGHSPCAFDQTWNQPPGSGPFKQVIASTVEISLLRPSP